MRPSISPTADAPGLPTVAPTGSPLSGGVAAPATGGGAAPALEPTTPAVSPISGGGALPAVAEQPAVEAEGAVAPTVVPAALPFTGLELSMLLLVGLLLLAGGAGAAIAGRVRPNHAAPGFWSR